MNVGSLQPLNNSYNVGHLSQLTGVRPANDVDGATGGLTDGNRVLESGERYEEIFIIRVSLNLRD